MSRKVLGSLAFVLAAAGCSASNGVPTVAAPPPAEPAQDGAILGNPRFFQLVPDDAFWVTHDDKRDRVLAGGARLELSPSGEVLASGWETDKATGGEILVGGLALAPHLGGGYVFWTQSRLFRATELTGELVPVGLGVADAADTTIRGVRNGLRGALIVTDAGPRELLPGASSATALADPGINDLAALDASRAIRLDAFGRTAWTTDGGKTWNDASQITGLGVRTLGVSPDELWFDTSQGRALLGKDGTLREPDGPTYRYVDYQRPFQMAFRGTRADREDMYWGGYREMQPLQAALAGGVRFPDGSAFGVMRGTVARVDLTSGKVLSVATDWLPNGIDCQPVQMGSSVLFACGSDDYQSGAYLLRSDGVEPPHVERYFSDDGAFVSDDHGGFGYTGSCKAEERYVDPEQQYYGRYGRYGYDEAQQEQPVEPVFCVRRGPDDWVERRIELDADTSLLAWIPRKDGTAVALVRAVGRGASLPELARDSQRESAQNGVRVVRAHREIDGWFWPSQQVRTYYGRGGGQQTSVDRRYRVLDDGTIVGWVSWTEQPDAYNAVQKWAGATLREGQRAELHELPATPLSMAIGGQWGVLTARDGRMFETTDRGRTWRAAGTAGLVPGAMQGTCSRLGCSFTTGARIGWGTPAVGPRVADEKRAEPPKAAVAVPLLACEPQGGPRAEQSTTSPAAATLGAQAKVILQTTFGATLELIRETPDALASMGQYGPYGPYGGYGGYPPPIASAAASAAPVASSKPKATAAPARTHTLVFRPPLDPLAPLVRLNATNAATNNRSRSVAMPLLGATGEVSFLFFADQNEIIVDRSDLVTVPLFDARRYYYYGDPTSALPGLRTASNRALLFGDFRRRASIEEHGPAPQKPAFYFALDREANRRRALTMGRRDDGGVGVIVLDATAPETAGVSQLDRVSTTLGAISRLAPWSSVSTADDPVCRADKKGYRALVPIDPSTWLALDSTKLPGVTLAKQGIALVRWSEERVCLEAIDVAVIDPRRREGSPLGENLVVRWASTGGASAKPGAAASEVTGALRSLELMQPLTCSLQRAK